MAGFGLEVVGYVSPDDAVAMKARMKQMVRPQLDGAGMRIGIVLEPLQRRRSCAELLTARDKGLRASWA